MCRQPDVQMPGLRRQLPLRGGREAAQMLLMTVTMPEARTIR